MSAEAKRGCGYRKIGGIYLVSDGLGEPCHRLPIPLEVCPTCHGGVKQSRGWTWIKPDLLGGNCDRVDGMGANPHCVMCPACLPETLGEKAGLLWIGDKFYTPQKFTQEAREVGVSRRISAVPHGFKIGEHFVLLAHPKAVLLKSVQRQDGLDGVIHDDTFGAGIFHVFKPTRIEKILADNASAEDVEKWEKQGFTVVKLPANDKDHRGSVFDKEDDD